MKKKIISFTFLILFALLLTYLAGEVDYTAASAIVESEFDDIGLGMAIFMEAFVSIHMSVFVLFPLAGIINKNKVPQTFAVLFGIRLVILIIGDIIAPGIMAIIDFMAVFFGAFVVVPLLGSFKVVTFKGFMESLPEGFKLMVPAVIILIFAWSLKGVGDALGIAAFVEGIVGANASASVVIPAVMFAVAIFLAFSTGTSWGTFAILVPIVVAMFGNAANMEMMIIAVSAVLAGAVCGDHISPISDTTVMSSAGAQCNHINHVSTQMQYALPVAGVCIVGYLIAGIVQNWIVALGVSLVILIVMLEVIRAKSNK